MNVSLVLFCVTGLSTGALVGIVIGVIALIAMVACVVAIAVLYRRDGKRPAEGGAIDVGSGQVQYDTSGDSVSLVHNLCALM